MQEKEPITSVNHSRKTVSFDAERTLATPHFDAAAIREARPAVPLKQLAARRSWPVALIVLAIMGGLAGGLIGGLLSTGYLKRGAAASSAPTAEAPAQPLTANAEATTAEGAAAAPSASEASPEREARATTEPAMIEQEPEKPESEAVSPRNEEVKADERTPPETQAALRAALNDWVAATNARNLDKQLSFYPPTMNVFYRQHNAPLAVVRADRERVFARADSINVQAETPNIELSRDGRTVTMRFLKRYAIAGGGMDRSGAVVQELRWQRVGGKWRITSERDVRVVR